jgi:hypothetical protein
MIKIKRMLTQWVKCDDQNKENVAHILYLFDLIRIPDLI